LKKKLQEKEYESNEMDLEEKLNMLKNEINEMEKEKLEKW